MEQEPTIAPRQAPPHTFACFGNMWDFKSIHIRQKLIIKSCRYFLPKQFRILLPPKSDCRCPRSGGRSRSQELPPRTLPHSATILSKRQLSAVPAYINLILSQKERNYTAQYICNSCNAFSGKISVTWSPHFLHAASLPSLIFPFSN